MTPFKFLINNPKVLTLSTIRHKDYYGIGVVHETTNEKTAYIGWLSYDNFPADFDYDLPVSFDDLIVLKR